MCEVCLVPNDNGDSTCCCCTTPRPGVNVVQNGNEAKDPATHGSANAEELVNDGERGANAVRRVRAKLDLAGLRSSALFIVGSSEIDQIPKAICDMEKVDASSELVPLFECANPTPVIDGINGSISAVACGALHTAVLTTQGKVFTFGCNDMGALGRSNEDGAKEEFAECYPHVVRLRQVVTKVTCGDNHTLFLSADGSVFFTGAFRDTSGNIGIADFSDLETLRNAKHFKTPMRLPFTQEGSTLIKDICSGENHCVILPCGGSGVYVMGSNEFGQLMLPADYKVGKFQEVDGLSTEDTTKLALTWPNFIPLAELGLDNRQPHLQIKRRRYGDEYINRIFTGYCTSFVETGVGRRVFGAGRNAQGELGCGGDQLCVTKVTELRGLRGLNISKIMGGQFFTIALTVGGNLYTWGNNCYTGHGGADDFAKQATPLKLSFFKDNVKEVFTGADCAFAITRRGHLYAWGSSQNYILGNGKDLVFQKTPERIPATQFNGFKVFNGMGGSQHTVFLCRKFRRSS